MAEHLVSLGLDIGSNSVGSAWVDTSQQIIDPAVSVFPAGVDEADQKRGAPKNQDRRSKRSLRRNIARRAERKRKLRHCLIQAGLFPEDAAAQHELFNEDPWLLRRRGLEEALSPHQFGRVLIHLSQRRGALGVHLPSKSDEEDEKINTGKAKGPGSKQSDGDAEDEDAKVKGAIVSTQQAMKNQHARTFGELMAIVAEERREPSVDKTGAAIKNKQGDVVLLFESIRNRLGRFEFHASRAMIHDEFVQLWHAQKSLPGPLANLLTDELKKRLDDPSEDKTWRYRGLLFGQRRTYWDAGTLGRCDLEPSDRCVPQVDRHASYFRVLETANNIRIQGPGDRDFRSLTHEERGKVIDRLRRQKTGSVATVRKALGIDKAALKKRKLPDNAYQLNLDRDSQREINTDWFFRAMVVEGVGEATWDSWDESKKEGLNRVVLRFDPAEESDQKKLQDVLGRLGLAGESMDAALKSWRSRGKAEKRMNLSRRAIRNLIPYMESAHAINRDLRSADEPMNFCWDKQSPINPAANHWLTQVEARQAFALDAKEGHAVDQTTSRAATDEQRKRYKLGGSPLNKADRHFLEKHPKLLPPAPKLANPVVRKAIHEVRHHVAAHMRKHGRKPDQIVIEFAREARKSAQASDHILFVNRKREKIRKEIIEQIVKPVWGDEFVEITNSQLRKAVDRVVLCQQQQQKCAYSFPPRVITETMAARGHGLEIDHIIPRSRSYNNSLNNRVLCFKTANQNKHHQTPREWWRSDFDNRIAAMQFMESYKPDKNDYFEARDYAAKWRNFTRENIPTEWKASQLTDTAYAARQVQDYLQQALWPNEPSYLADSPRRILVTKGKNTATLRREWQLYEKVLSPDEKSFEEVQKASAKNRGDHREHAVDAVVIALTDGKRLEALAKLARQWEDRHDGAGPVHPDKPHLPTPWPWTDLQVFRRQVIGQIYPDSHHHGDKAADNGRQPLVVCHRAVGNKISGAFHEETLFGPVSVDEGLFTGYKAVTELAPNHLRLPVPETEKQAVERLAKRYMDRGVETDPRKARERAKDFVACPAFTPAMTDPPPGKSGLVRDAGLRRVLRKQIDKCAEELGLTCHADTFTKSDMNRMLKEGPLTMPSGVPVHRVKLLRTMKDPVIIPRKQWDPQKRAYVYDASPRSARAYVGGNNHHIEIREDKNGRWSGRLITTFQAAQLIRGGIHDAVDRSDDPALGGRFVMSLAEGETVYMREKDSGQSDYFVVFKLDKPQTVQFKRHWDARRATGEKDDNGNLKPNTQRQSFAFSPRQLQDLAPAGEDPPIKVSVSPLGEVRRIAPRITS